ncbi:hypothetical protein BB559_002736 [Furculomyces boomerangus]|uniref:Acyl-CoA thioesterase II n=1 Tax=Furculomyces boomerangus TaxID=61424 RepID=A0A2T9YSX0_9FUNG|nr:hypothetical protein BB559_002736 [Furculomyces boomerangus]
MFSNAFSLCTRSSRIFTRLNLKQKLSAVNKIPLTKNNVFPSSKRSLVTEAIGIDKINSHIFRSKELLIMHGSKGVYGGQIVGQALLAASQTIDPKYHVNSLHSYFTFPGDNRIPIYYHVEEIRNGRMFSSRIVHAKQNNKIIFSMTCSFQVPMESNLVHQNVMPIVQAPENYPQKLSSEGNRHLFEMKEDGQYDMKTKIGKIEAECRFIGHPDTNVQHRELSDSALSPYLLWWYKATGDLSKESNFVHQSAVAYHSDYQLVYTSLLPHKVGSRSEREFLKMMVSLDHCVWFHAPVRGDEWLLYQMESHRASSSRVLLTGKLFNMQGDLVASIVQEGLMKSSDTVIEKLDPKTISTMPPSLISK